MVGGLIFSSLTGFTFPLTYLPFILIVAAVVAFFKRTVFLIFAVALLCLYWGVLVFQPYLNPSFPPNHIARQCNNGIIIVEGLVSRRPFKTERGCRIILQVERYGHGAQLTTASGRLMIYVGNGESNYRTGDRIRLLTRIKAPRTLGIPGEFNIVKWLALQEIYVTAFVENYDELILAGCGDNYLLQRRIDLIALKLGEFISSHTSKIESSVLRALLLGDMGYVPKEIKDEYTRTGINHILSISGFHVGIISLVLFQLLLQAARLSLTLQLYYNVRRLALLITLPVVIFYMLLVGAAPATVRSVIMLTIFILAMFLEREVDPINSLIVAAITIIALAPQSLFDLSFQLSFTALWGIFILTPLFMTPFPKIKAIVPKFILLIAMSSAAATVATLLPVVYYFHRSTFTGLIGNLVAVPLIGYGAVVFGFIALPIVYVVPFVAEIFLKIAALMVTLNNLIIHFLAKIPLLPLFNSNRWQLFTFYLILLALTLIVGNRSKLIICLFLVGVFAGIGCADKMQQKGELQIIYFSIGQGDATLVVFPSGRRMLIDGGGNFRTDGSDIGERVLAPALWSLGIDKIDYLVLSHPHPDHLQGLKYIASNFKIREFWEGEVSSTSSDYIDLKAILASRGIICRRGLNGIPNENGVRFDLISAGNNQRQKSNTSVIRINETSLVFRIKVGEFAALFTGDIGKQTEKILLQQPELLNCTILKVPHHGSQYSMCDELLRSSWPSVAVISSGYRNIFGLPSPASLSLLHNSGINVYRTDLDGTIRVDYYVSSGKWSIKRLAQPFSLTSL